MRKRWPALLLLALAACGEPTATRLTPTDRFAFPASVAVTARLDAGSGLPTGASALLVASGNYDLNYDGANGGTVLSVDPALALADGSGGSAGRTGGALVRLGEGAHVGSFVGQLVVADQATCPGFVTAERPPQALVATRFADQIWRLSLGPDGHLGPCEGAACVASVEPQLHDPFGMALACRPLEVGGADDGKSLRRSAFVGYLRTGSVSGSAVLGWIAELDLDAPSAPARTLALGSASIAGLAYDVRTDRLFALGEMLLAAPVYILDLAACPASQATCPKPAVSYVDLSTALAGLDLQAIALSNHQDGLGRRAYVTARVYDPILAASLRGRPAVDVTSLLLVLDLEEDLRGRPSLSLLRAVPIGMGASQVTVLPARDPVGGVPRRDVVVVSAGTEGVVTVYDDDTGDVVRVIPLDDATGAPEAGRAPFGLAVEPATSPSASGPVARVYVAAVQQAQVGIIDVPLDAPGQARALRDASGVLVRIGGLQ